MSSELARTALITSKAIQDEVNQYWFPPADSMSSWQDKVLDKNLVKRTRGYIEIVVNQINSTYENGSYDACAVMIRRLIETLIIEVYEQNHIAERIQNQNGEFLPLSELIGCMLKEAKWNLGRDNAKVLQSLPKLKGIGDLAAHNRRYNAIRSDIDKVIPGLRTLVQELIYLANFK